MTHASHGSPSTTLSPQHLVLLYGIVLDTVKKLPEFFTQKKMMFPLWREFQRSPSLFLPSTDFCVFISAYEGGIKFNQFIAWKCPVIGLVLVIWWWLVLKFSGTQVGVGQVQGRCVDWVSVHQSSDSRLTAPSVVPTLDFSNFLNVNILPSVWTRCQKFQIRSRFKQSLSEFWETWFTQLFYNLATPVGQRFNNSHISWSLNPKGNHWNSKRVIHK